MARKEYSAGAVKHSFWFLEFRKTVSLLQSGNSYEDIKRMNQEENIFSAPTQERAKQIYNTVSARVQSLDESFFSFFPEGELATQKIIALISVLNTDSLFFDFMYEVYREKLIIGNDQLSDMDMRVFFKNKQIQSDRVAGWQDYTLKRLGTCYKTFMLEAGIISRQTEGASIVKPVLDSSLKKRMIDTGMEQFINALTGVR